MLSLSDADDTKAEESGGADVQPISGRLFCCSVAVLLFSACVLAHAVAHPTDFEAFHRAFMWIVCGIRIRGRKNNIVELGHNHRPE